MSGRFAVILTILVAGMLVLNRWVTEPLHWEANSADMLHALTLAVLASWLGAGAWGRLTGEELRKTLRHAVIWIGIFLGVAILHTYRFELAGVRDRVMADLFPGRIVEKTPGRMQFRISPDGHFYINARVNGTNVRFLADTGASDIVLTPAAADRAGFDPAYLNFNRIYQTANGMGMGAAVELEDLQIGDLRLQNIPASVNRAPMSNSLLGMSFFNRLGSYAVRDGILTIQW